MITVLVDVSNLDANQVFSLYRSGHRPLFVSTSKSFHFKMIHERPSFLPRVVRHGTRWLVLTPPIGDTSSPDTYIHEFDEASQRFRVRRSTSPVSLTYHGRKRRHGRHLEQMCSIRANRRTTEEAHVFCEIDDFMIARMAASTGLPVATNDMNLARIVNSRRTPRSTREMRALERHTTTTMLVLCHDGMWRVDRNRNASTPCDV